MTGEESALSVSRSSGDRPARGDDLAAARAREIANCAPPARKSLALTTQRILVVAGERDFRDQVCLCLRAEGREVFGAGGCREAIRAASRAVPDVLVADWMLPDHRHGLHVSAALAALNPGLRTVLMTGYASADVRADAEKQNVAAFLAKPFEPEQLREAVRRAAHPKAPIARHPPVGVFRLDADRDLVRANPVATGLLGDDPAGFWAPMERAPADWREVRPGLWVRGRDCADRGMLLVVLDEERLAAWRDHPVVHALLGVPVPASAVPGHVLLVDRDDGERRSAADRLRRSGCPCLTAENAEVAMRLFRRDEKIAHVLLDGRLPRDDVRDLARRFREIRPAVRVVGLGGEDRRAELRRLGVERLLERPVGVDALREELRASPPVPRRESSAWSLQLDDLARDFGAFMARRPGARATRAISVVKVLCDAWPRALTVQEIVETLWAKPAARVRRAAGSVRNALNTVGRNVDGFNRTVAEPLHGLRCALWRSGAKD